MERVDCKKRSRDRARPQPAGKCAARRQSFRSCLTCRPQLCVRRSRSCQRGAAIVEAVIALPILLVVILGAIQFGLIYEAKATLNHASLQAARAGAVSNARPDAIRRGLARGLAPLYSSESSLEGFARTVARINAELIIDARLRILNPTREAFADFAEEVDDVREIPNDRLHARSTAIGAQSRLNIQDANLLKVEITYGYELKVPLVNWFISRVLLGVFGRLVREDSADRGVTHYGYDGAGNLVEKTDGRGEQTRFTYDAIGRLTEVLRRDGRTRLTYEQARLAKISGPSSEERFSYSVDGQLETHARTIAGRIFKTSYRYDPKGRLDVRTLPSGQRLRYHYAHNDSLRAIAREGVLNGQLLVGSPESEADKTPAVPIDALGRLIYGNGLAASTTYADAGRFERRIIPSVNTAEYGYDESGRITGTVVFMAHASICVPSCRPFSTVMSPSLFTTVMLLFHGSTWALRGWNMVG